MFGVFDDYTISSNLIFAIIDFFFKLKKLTLQKVEHFLEKCRNFRYFFFQASLFFIRWIYLKISINANVSVIAK